MATHTGTRLLIVFAAIVAYAVVLVGVPSKLAITVAPLVTGVVMGTILAKTGCGGKCAFLLAFVGGTAGSLIVPLYLGSLVFHIRVSGEFLTTPIAVMLLLYHGLATGLLAYVSQYFYHLSLQPSQPPSTEHKE